MKTMNTPLLIIGLLLLGTGFVMVLCATPDSEKATPAENPKKPKSGDIRIVKDWLKPDTYNVEMYYQTPGWHCDGRGRLPLEVAQKTAKAMQSTSSEPEVIEVKP